MERLTMNALGLSLLLALSNVVSCQQQESSCNYDRKEIELGLNASGNVDSFVVNCVAHKAISISVYYSSQLGSGDDSLRYDFQCFGSTWIPTLSRQVSNITNAPCTACNETAAEPCEEQCDGYLQLVTTHDNESLYLLPGEEFTYKCIGNCVRPDKSRQEGDIKFCDVCGVEKCVYCDGHCTECVSDYRVAEHEDEDKDETECITEEEWEKRRREELKKLTEELMREQEHEEEERENTVLLLQILLPIFCILTLVACVGMSVFTHYWYPYIDEKGKKRIKTKPTEEPEPTVWRPRPTIRFR